MAPASPPRAVPMGPALLIGPFALAAFVAASGWAEGAASGLERSVWVDQFGSVDRDSATDVAVAGSGFFVTWRETDRAYVRGYDPDGQLAWQANLSAQTSAPAVVWASDDYVCVGGDATTPLEGDVEEIDGKAGYVRCLDPQDGSPLWTRYVEARPGASSPQARVHALAGDRDQVVVAGTTSDAPLGCVRKGCPSTRGPGVFFHKYRARDGALLWSRQLAGVGQEAPFGIAIDSSGGVDVWSVAYATSGRALVEVRIRLRRLDPSGTVRAEAEAGWGSPSPPTALALSGSDLFVAGPSGTGARVQRYTWDPLGGLLQPTPWSLSLPSAEVHGMRVDASGLIVAGKARVGPYVWDAFVSEYGLEDGAERWSLSFGAVGHDQASAVTADASRVFVAGKTEGAMEPGGHVGESDAFAARFAEPFAADAGGPYWVDEGSTVALSASATAFDYGQTLSYAWDLDRDGSFETAGQSVVYGAVDDGEVSVSVQVTDDYSEGKEVDQATIAVANVAPIVDAGPAAVLLVGEPFARQGLFTDPGADSWTATVDYGDGAGVAALALGAGKTFALAHSYAAPGSYTVTVTVADDDGGAGTASFGVAVQDAGTVTIADLVAAVELLVRDGVLNQGQGRSLVSKLDDAQAALDAGDGRTAVESLRAFIHEVEALENAGILDASQAGTLVDMARAVIASIPARRPTRLDGFRPNRGADAFASAAAS